VRTSPTEPLTVDASGLVSRVMAPYRMAINTILGQVTGDPASVRRAEVTYRAGVAASTQVATNVAAVSSRLAESWHGSASNAYAGASQDLTGGLDHVQLTLSRQADGMAQVLQAQAQIRGGVEQALRGFDAAQDALLAMSRNVHPGMVAPLLSQARSTAAAFHSAATAHRTSLARVLSEVAGSLDEAASAQPVFMAGRQRRKPKLTPQEQARRAEERARLQEEERQKARCPFTRAFGSSVERMLSKHEGAVKRRYLDGRGIPTIGVGFNLNRSDAKDVINRILTAHPGNLVTADIRSGKAFQELYNGRRELTEEQLLALLALNIPEARRHVINAGVTNFDDLPAPVQAALIDVAFQRPRFFTEHKSVITDINNGDYAAAADAIEKWGAAIAAKDPRGQGGAKPRNAQNATMLRNQC
jgi:GH24 family phage-related lysozyme (muramidase)